MHAAGSASSAAGEVANRIHETLEDFLDKKEGGEESRQPDPPPRPCIGVLRRHAGMALKRPAFACSWRSRYPLLLLLWPEPSPAGFPPVVGPPPWPRQLLR